MRLHTFPTAICDFEIPKRYRKKMRWREKQKVLKMNDEQFTKTRSGVRDISQPSTLLAIFLLFPFLFDSIDKKCYFAWKRESWTNLWRRSANAVMNDSDYTDHFTHAVKQWSNLVAKFSSIFRTLTILTIRIFMKLNCRTKMCHPHRSGRVMNTMGLENLFKKINNLAEDHMHDRHSWKHRMP